jgi:hypothetical protein
LILSTTVTIAVSELEFPLLSVTVSVTVFIPISPQSKVVLSKLLRSSSVGVTSSVEPLSISSTVILASPLASNSTTASWVITLGATVLSEFTVIQS